MKDFRNLSVWQKAHELVLAIYGAARTFPRDEQYGLTSQIRRSGVSVAANLAEGCGRGTDSDFARFAQMAMGSASEVEYHLLLARDLKILDTVGHQNLSSKVVEVKRMLASLLKRLRADARMPKDKS